MAFYKNVINGTSICVKFCYKTRKPAQKTGFVKSGIWCNKISWQRSTWHITKTQWCGIWWWDIQPVVFKWHKCFKSSSELKEDALQYCLQSEAKHCLLTITFLVQTDDNANNNMDKGYKFTIQSNSRVSAISHTVSYVQKYDLSHWIQHKNMLLFILVFFQLHQLHKTEWYNDSKR